MSYVLDLPGLAPEPRADGVPYVSVAVEEGPSPDGPFLPLQTIPTTFPADLTVADAQYPDGWYVLTFAAQDGAVVRWPPKQRDDLARGAQYTTVEALRFTLAQGGDTSDPGTAASMGDEDLEDAIADAQAEVDARVGGAEFPAGEVPSLVANVTRDVAAYLATLTFRKGDPLDPNDPVRLRYQRAQGILADIGRGKIELSGEPDPEGDAFVQNPYEGDLWSLAGEGIGPDPRRMGRASSLAWDDPYGW